MTPRQIENRIDKLARKRQLAWSAGYRAQEVFDLTRQLDELYMQLRLERARRSYGDGAKIRQRARVEQELEKLMTA